MQQSISLQLLPREANDHHAIQLYLEKVAGVDPNSITGFTIIRRSIDARSKQPLVNLSILAFINEPFVHRAKMSFQFKDVHKSKTKVLIVGAGPAGLFAALQLLEAGICPVIIERGKDVRLRRRDLAALNKEGEVNPDSNYCFGEGGAGTYSDGKLYTRSTKRGDVSRILQLFVHFGADEQILYEAHPHIGTNKLPAIITAMRELIINCGGQILFEHKLTDFIIKDQVLKGVVVNHQLELYAEAVILATGHSARDIFHLLADKQILIEAKPFALGVRAEHPQALIDATQYRCGPYIPGGDTMRSEDLPPASYSLVQQVEDRGVFSFCMCPGGIIAPAATDAGELVVNGWSPSKRNNPYANSGIVAQVQPKDLLLLNDFPAVMDLPETVLQSTLGMLYFQQYVERKAFMAGGGKFVAPAQRMADFCNNKLSLSLPDCSYIPGLSSSLLTEVIPSNIAGSLQQAFIEFGKKMKGYYTNEAVLVATESRTSSPVRIPRDRESLQHPQIDSLYPCGEGAGYAGGIVSAAMDGERVASVIISRFKSN